MNSPMTQAAGNFGQVTVNSTLTLSGGTYQFQNLTFGTNAVLQASAASIVRVAGKISGATANFVHIGPTGTQPAGNFRLMVAGTTDTNGGVTLGTDAKVTALVVSLASFSAADRFAGKGALAAKNIIVGNDSSMTFQTGFECNADAACNDGNPCTTDACVDAKCIHAALANGTACPDDGNVCTSDACSAGVCAHPALANGTACTGDNNECTTDQCTGGMCVHPAIADGTACAADPDGVPDDACQLGLCLHRPIVPFVNCVAQTSTDTFMALFGYEDRDAANTTVPAGPQNHLEPTSSLVDAQPPTVLEPGEHVAAFWAPLSNGAVDWVLAGSRAHATSSSPRCSDAVYPPSSTAPAKRRGETPSRPGPLAVRPAPYDSGPQVPEAFKAQSAPQAVLDFGAPFEVTLTFLEVGNDGCFQSRYADAEVFINGNSAGRQHIYDDGCVFCVDSCNLRTRDLDVTFSRTVAVGDPAVDVRVVLYEVDNTGTDTVLDHSFTVDNRVGQPQECEDGKDLWGACWTVRQVGLPPNLVEPRVCTTWNAAFIDSGFGEDDTGTPVAGAGFSRYPAAFAPFFLTVNGPLGSTGAGGFLDQDGCVPPGMIPDENFLFFDGEPAGLDIELSLDARVLRRPDGVNYTIASQHYQTGLAMSSKIPGQVPLDQWSPPSGVWCSPPARIDVTNSTITPVTNIAATVTTLLSRPDMGYTLDDPTTPNRDEGSYAIWQGGPTDPSDCQFFDEHGREYCESLGASNSFRIGFQLPELDAPACRADADCAQGQSCFQANCGSVPAGTDCRTGGIRSGFGGTDIPCNDQAQTCYCTPGDDTRWKFVIAHEAGHQVEERGIGTLPTTDYTFICPSHTACTGRSGETGVAGLLSDPPLVPETAPYCSCQWVTSANGLHCLQSIERPESAQTEGLAHFFASRAWNKQEEADCRFNYYKEFVDHTCDSGGCQPKDDISPAGFLNPPPISVDCIAAHKWRNRNCPINGDMSTELDWLNVLYNLNAVGATRSPMTDIFKIYRQACLPPPAPGDVPNLDPPPCASNFVSFDVAWDAVPPGLVIPSNGVACLSDADCSNGLLCREGTSDSVAACNGVDCLCKVVKACTIDADCDAGSSCRDDAQGSALIAVSRFGA